MYKLFEKYTYLPLTVDNFFHVTNTVLHKNLIALSSDRHPGSKPYLSGDTFAKLADQVLNNERAVLDYTSVHRGDVIHVNIYMLPYFFRCVHPLIRFPYVLITHNGDIHIDVPQTQYIDNKIIHWFAQNVVVKHPKVTPIPIGLENLHYYNHGQVTLFDMTRKSSIEKQNRILMDFSVSTNPYIRKPLHELFRNNASVTDLQERLSANRYVELLSKHKFVLSPPGNGLDCHRTWEAMYVETIPIVEKSVTTTYFKQLGLPILLVSNWKEVSSLSPKQLDKIYNDIMNTSDTSAMWYPYWKKRIHSYKSKKAV